MRDKVTVDRVATLHPFVRTEATQLIDKAEEGLPANLAVRVVQGYRSVAEQDALYAQGRSKPGPIVTKARGGSSFHNYGLAIDFAILEDKDGNGTYDDLSWDIRRDNDKDGTADWLEIVKIFEGAGWEWGGKWASIKDYPHVQKTFGYTWQQLLVKYGKREFLPGTKYLNLEI